LQTFKLSSVHQLTITITITEVTVSRYSGYQVKYIEQFFLLSIVILAIMQLNNANKIYFWKLG